MAPRRGRLGGCSMSRRPTRRLTLQFVRRTLARLRMVTRLDHEKLAVALLPYRDEVQYLGDYLNDVAYYMKKHAYVLGRLSLSESHFKRQQYQQYRYTK
jgi:hypothetical protein